MDIIYDLNWYRAESTVQKSWAIRISVQMLLQIFLYVNAKKFGRDFQNSRGCSYYYPPRLKVE